MGRGNCGKMRRFEDEKNYGRYEDLKIGRSEGRICAEGQKSGMIGIAENEDSEN